MLRLEALCIGALGFASVIFIIHMPSFFFFFFNLVRVIPKIGLFAAMQEAFSNSKI